MRDSARSVTLLLEFFPQARVQSDEMIVKERDPFLWLAPNLGEDEASYEEYAKRLMTRLRRYFAGNGCVAADDMASESIFRLTKKLAVGGLEIDDTDERTKFLFGIAKYVLAEWRRGPEAKEMSLRDTDGDAYALPPVDLIGDQCLELLKDTIQKSLAQLSATDREILLQTVLNGECRRTLAALAKEKGIQAPAMRQRGRRTRLRFEEMLLASERIDDLLRCLGLKRGSA
jgi:DNA-directed RNA polymerase specialized sigma24 family protein